MIHLVFNEGYWSRHDEAPMLLGELGRHAEAVTELTRALGLARNAHERAEIEARLSAQRASAGGR